MQEIISKSFPYKLAFKSLLIITAGAIITGAVCYLVIYEKFGPSYQETLELIAKLKQNLLYKTIIIYLATSFFLIGIAVMTLIYSHRVAGPIYRLGLTARTITDGYLRLQVHLREKDVVHPLAQSLNNVAKHYGEIVEQLGKELEALKDIPTKINGLTVSGRSKEVRKAVNAASEKVKNINTILSNIKL